MLPPRPPALAPLPVRAWDLVVLLVLLVASVFLIPGLLALVWPGIASLRLLPVVALIVGQSLWMLFLTWLVVLRRYRLRLADIGVRATDRAWYRLAVAVGLLCVPAASLINYGVQSLMSEPMDNPQLRALAPEGFNWTSFVAMLLLLSVMVPFVEEIIFRGLVFGWLRKHMRFSFAAPLSAVLFAAAHGLPAQMPALAMMGLVLAWIVERSGSLRASMIVHGVFNGLMTVIFYTALASGAAG